MQVTPSVVDGPRVFKNRDGDWKKVEASIAEIKKFADVMDGLIKDIVTVEKKIQDLTLAAYKELPETDSLFLDCPISPAKQTYFLRAHLFRDGSQIVRGILSDVTKIEDFSKAIKDGCAWLLKFKTKKSN